MSTDADNKASPSASEQCSAEDLPSTEEASTKKKPPRKVCFPDEEHIVTQYFEPANPWQDVPPTTRTQLAAEYLESCRRHNTPPIDSVLEQIRELPDGVVGGGTRAARLTLASCSLLGAAPCDALETVLRRAQFRRIELECAEIDDEGAEALFDMIEYYESATVVAITGPRYFGIRGWQAASRMIKKSAELSELEVSDGPVEGAHAPVLARALRPHSCRLRALSLQRAALAGEPLLCLVIALKCNRSVRELRVCDNQLTHADAAQLGALLKLNARIQLLDLSNNQIQDAGVGHLADALVEQASQSPPSPAAEPLSPHQCPLVGFENRGLAFLVLWNNQLTRNCVHNLIKMVRGSKSLCVLNVGRNAIGSAAIRALGAGGLLSLGLQAARLAPDAAPLLHAALAADTHLQRIDLRGNRLGVEGLQAILSALETNKTLTQVDLDEPAESSSLAGALDAATRLTLEVRAACRRNEPVAAPQRRVHRKISLTCHTSCLQRVSHCSSLIITVITHELWLTLEVRAACRRNEPVAAPQRRVHRKISLTCHTSCLQRVSHCSSLIITVITHELWLTLEVRAACRRNEPVAAPQRRVHRKISLTCHTSCLQRVSHCSSLIITVITHELWLTLEVRAACRRNEPVAAPQRRVHRKISLTCHTSCLQRVSHCSSLIITVITHELWLTLEVRAACRRNEPVAAPQRRVHRKISLTCHTSCLQRVSHCSSLIITVITHELWLTLEVRAACRRNEPVAAPQRRVHRKISLTCHTSCLQRVSHCSSLIITVITHELWLTLEVRAACRRNEPVAAPQRRVHRKISLTCHTSCLQRVSHCSSLIITVITHELWLTLEVRAACRRNEPVAAPQRRVHRKISLTCHTSCLQRVSHCSSLIITVITHELWLTLEVRAACRRNEPVAAPQRRVHRKISLTCHTSCLQRVSHCSSLIITVITHELWLTLEVRAACRRNEPVAAPQRRVHRKISLTCHTSCLQRVSHCSSLIITVITHELWLTLEVRAACRRNEPVAAPQRRVHRKISLTCHTSCLQRVSHCSSLIITVITHELWLTLEVRAACRRNEPVAAPQRRVHRKISLTCHTSCLQRGLVAEEERRGPGRLRSPAPSPAGSPVPSAHPSRFSVTRVTPDRAPTPELSGAGGLRAGYNAPSRFKVVQVAEPPQIQVQSATPEQPRRSASRFSVTRNLDTIYNPGFVPSPPPTPMAAKSRPRDDHAHCGAQHQDNACASAAGNPPPGLNKENSDALEKTRVKLSDKLISEDVNSVAVPVSDKDCVNKHLEDVFLDKSEALSHDEAVSVIGDNKITKTETKLVKSSQVVRENEKIDVQVSVSVKTESVDDAKCGDQINDNFRNIDEQVVEKRDDVAFKQIEALTENLGNIIEEMRDRSKTVKAVKVKSDCTQTDINIDSKLDTFDDVPVINRDNIVLKKNKSESSLDSPDLEVSRLMNKKLVCSPFFDSSSSLEISGSSMESLNALDNQTAKPIIVQESVESDSELDRRKSDVVLSTASSIESTSEVTPVNSGNFLNMSVSSNESVSPIIFGKNKKIHGSLSSLEASVSSLESKHDKVMLTSADSGIEYSLQHPTENKEDDSSNEGTLTNNSSLKETGKTDNFQIQDTLTCSPKRTSSLLDVPALKTKGLDRMRKISWVAPSASFHIPRPEPEKESKLPGHLEKLLSIFQHPSSIFSRSCEDEKKSNSNTPPRKDSSLTSSFWAWGSGTEKSEDREDRDSLSEATDSTLSERVQVYFVDESFSKKLDSKTPSTDTDNTLSEFQSFPQGNSETSEAEPDKFKVTDNTTDDNLVQKCIGLSLNDASANGNKNVAKACDTVDLNKPNDLNKNYDMKTTSESVKSSGSEAKTDVKEEKMEPVIPRSFAAVLKASSTENSLEKQSPETGQSVDKLPSKVIRDIKENISPENTLTSSMTKALAFEVTEKQIKNQPIVNALWEVTLDNEIKKDEVKVQSDLAPIATIEETCDETLETAPLDFIDDIKFIDEKNASGDSGVTLESTSEVKVARELDHVDLGKDALSYLIYENQDFEPGVETSVKTQVEPGSLAQELREAEIKEQLLDLSPELVVDAAEEVPEVLSKEAVGLTSPIIPERAKLKKSSSVEDFLHQVDQKRTIAFKVPVIVSTPRDIPERRSKLRSKSGTSPKSLPESLNKPSPLSKMDPILSKKKKKVSSLGKIAKDSLLALNMSEEEMAEFRRSYKLTSVESLRSLESVSEDANSQSNSVDSRCRSCLRTSQESLMSCDSINEECRCVDNERPSHSGR